VDIGRRKLKAETKSGHLKEKVGDGSQKRKPEDKNWRWKPKVDT
jgi:hypothetical protein